MFKPGDKVYYIGDNSYGEFLNNEIYEIVNINRETDTLRVKVKGNPLWWYASRFKKVEDFVSKPYIVFTGNKKYLVVAENLEEAKFLFKMNSDDLIRDIKESSSEEIYEIV